MNLFTIDTGLFKLDGGAMFGVVPRTIWQKTNPPDENNLCTWAMRCLLIENGTQRILVDNGIGTKQDEKFLRHYYLHGDDNLIHSIQRAGFSPTEITDVVLTHLHFDHCGGSVQYDSAGKPVLTFPNARYWTNTAHWQWATHPNAREKASFLKENLSPMQESGHLHFLEPDTPSPFADIDFLYVDGHTEKMMLPVIRHKNHTFVYMADLIPSASHVPIPYVMGYDVRPLRTMDEKTTFLQTAADQHYVLIFEHDPTIACATVTTTERGVRIHETGTLRDFITR